MKPIVRLSTSRAALAASVVAAVIGAAPALAIEPQGEGATPRDADIQTAELALGAGDCRSGAERYAALAEARRDTRIARRAVEVAMT